VTRPPVLAHTGEELEAVLSDASGGGRQGERQGGRQVALVPTMGALHDGHASLLRTARERVADGPVVASVFVNPLQFGPSEDLDRYPRTLDADLEVCEREGVDVVFAPAVEEVYRGWPEQPQVTVDPGPLGTVLEGRTRPGHFRGVLTVVAKLFGLVRPDVAVFGQKDYQQLVLVRRMVDDLCLTGSRGAVEVVGAETRREPDGLALSSRNRFLDTDERLEAAALSRALRAAQFDARRGVAAALGAARAALRATHVVDLDYLVITDRDLGELPPDVRPGTEARILVAAKLGRTRLIDNLPLTIGQPEETT
jgi:pantoate--beta-alanine ligase